MIFIPIFVVIHLHFKLKKGEAGLDKFRKIIEDLDKQNKNY